MYLGSQGSILPTLMYEQLLHHKICVVLGVHVYSVKSVEQCFSTFLPRRTLASPLDAKIDLIKGFFVDLLTPSNSTLVCHGTSVENHWSKS